MPLLSYRIMALFKVSYKEIKAITPEDPKTWPIELTVWIENWKKDWSIPWFVPIEMEKQFHRIRMNRKPGQKKRARIL